jgi:magnesium transporter
VIVDCAIYQDGTGTTVDGDISDALDAARGNGRDVFMWIALHEPTAEEFELVAQELRLHPLAVEDAVEAHQRPKLERYDDTLFVVLKTVRYAKATHDVEVGDFMLFVGRDWVITVGHGEGDSLERIRRRLRQEPELLLSGPGAVLYAACDQVIDVYGVVAHDIEADIIALERRVFAPDRSDVAEAIYELKREVLEFRGAEDPLIPALQDIVKGRTAVNRDLLPYFRDAHDHLLRVDGTVDAHSELLTNVLNAHLAQVGMQQNEDMRKIAAWAAILAVPTAIAGIYGMNFKHMPELEWWSGYPFALAVMAVSCLVVFHRLRKSGWL